MSRLIFVTLKYFFALLLFASAIGKLLDNQGFADVLATYQFGIPSSVRLVMGLLISFFELGLAYRIFKNKFQSLNGFLITGMHTGYLFLAIITNLRGIDVPNCGCFGVFLARPMTWQTVVEDAILVILSFTFWKIAKTKS